MRFVLVCVVTCLLSACGANPSSSSLADSRQQSSSGAYPTHPDLTVTPGVLCSQPDSYRYAEHIPYCSRDVSSSTKRDIISFYDRTFGFSIESMNRTQFKIDHFIPLCMGGANERGNLWPQHQSVFMHTDPLEQKLCDLMSRGLMTQAAAVEKIRYIKFHLEEANTMQNDLDSRLQR